MAESKPAAPDAQPPTPFDWTVTNELVSATLRADAVVQAGPLCTDCSLTGDA